VESREDRSSYSTSVAFPLSPIGDRGSATSLQPDIADKPPMIPISRCRGKASPRHPRVCGQTGRSTTRMVLFGTRLCPVGEGAASHHPQSWQSSYRAKYSRTRGEEEEGGGREGRRPREMLSRLMSLSRYRPRRRVVLVFWNALLTASSTLDGRKLRIRMPHAELLACRSHPRVTSPSRG